MENEPEFQSGALLDTRSEEEKLKDYKFEEIVASANPVTWVEKTQTQWRHFPIFNQDGSGSCVAQTMAKLLGVLYWLKNSVYIHFSATDIYQRRANKPDGGMGGIDVFKVARKGVTLEDLVPSQNMSDSQMDSIDIPQYKKDVGTVFKISNYVEVPPGDIETVASIIETTKKAVMVWFYFKRDEWTEHPQILHPTIDRAASDTARHSVTAVDFALVDGKKCLIIDDSWGPNYGFGGVRVIDEDFFRERNFFVAYPVSFKFDDPTPNKPKYTFTKSLDFGTTGTDVVALQDILKFEGMFPSNVASTGVYGAITASGILKWQTQHNVAPLAELNQLQGRRVGPKTVAALNSIYS